MCKVAGEGRWLGVCRDGKTAQEFRGQSNPGLSQTVSPGPGSQE